MDRSEMSEPKDLWLDYVVKSSREFNDEICRDLSIVESIDSQIKSLVAQRNYVLHGLNCKCLAHKSAVTCLGCASPRRLWAEYEKAGFKSEEVKSVVMNIRKLFFDESKEKFRDFCCTQIINEDWWEGTELKFVFEDSCGHSMSLDFDVKDNKHKHLYSDKILNGYVYFTAKVGRDFSVIDKSFDISKLRKSIEAWIDSGFKAEEFQFEHETLEESIASSFRSFEALECKFQLGDGDGI